MYQILTLNKISPVGLSRFGEDYACSDSCANPDAVLVRSAAMHDYGAARQLAGHRPGGRRRKQHPAG